MKVQLSVEELALIKRLVAERVAGSNEPIVRAPGSGWVVPKVHSMSSEAAKALLKKLNAQLYERAD